MLQPNGYVLQDRHRRQTRRFEQVMGVRAHQKYWYRYRSDHMYHQLRSRIP